MSGTWKTLIYFSYDGDDDYSLTCPLTNCCCQGGGRGPRTWPCLGRCSSLDEFSEDRGVEGLEKHCSWLDVVEGTFPRRREFWCYIKIRGSFGRQNKKKCTLNILVISKIIVSLETLDHNKWPQTPNIGQGAWVHPVSSVYWAFNLREAWMKIIIPISQCGVRN